MRRLRLSKLISVVATEADIQDHAVSKTSAFFDTDRSAMVKDNGISQLFLFGVSGVKSRDERYGRFLAQHQHRSFRSFSISAWLCVILSVLSEI